MHPIFFRLSGSRLFDVRPDRTKVAAQSRTGPRFTARTLR